MTKYSDPEFKFDEDFPGRPPIPIFIPKLEEVQTEFEQLQFDITVLSWKTSDHVLHKIFSHNCKNIAEYAKLLHNRAALAKHEMGLIIEEYERQIGILDEIDKKAKSRMEK